jgi:ABC-type glycerol-3-phosphate transport system permease component
LAIFAFTMIWKDYLWQLIVGSTENMLTLPIGVGRMSTQREYTNYGLLMAGATFNFIPMLILFARFQDYFMKGVTAGAVKG